MADDPKKRGRADRERISLQQDHELYGWARKFNVTPDQLREAVAAVGHMASDVEAYLSPSKTQAEAAAPSQPGIEGSTSTPDSPIPGEPPRGSGPS